MNNTQNLRSRKKIHPEYIAKIILYYKVFAEGCISNRPGHRVVLISLKKFSTLYDITPFDFPYTQNI